MYSKPLTEDEKAQAKERYLSILKKQFENGQITEEEYHQRVHIAERVMSATLKDISL